MALNGPMRLSSVIEQVVDDELVVYHLDNEQVHLLNRTTAAVWRHCDGTNSVAALADAVGRDLGTTVDDDIVWAALAELDRAGLLDQPLRPGATSISRRQLVKRLALGAVAVPVVTSILAPTAAAAASVGCLPDDSPCTSGTECCSGICDGVCTSGGPPGCVSNADCPPLFVCQAGTCVPAGPPPCTPSGPCRLDGDCCPGEVCINGLCSLGP